MVPAPSPTTLSWTNTPIQPDWHMHQTQHEFKCSPMLLPVPSQAYNSLYFSVQLNPMRWATQLLNSWTVISQVQNEVSQPLLYLIYKVKIH